MDRLPPVSCPLDSTGFGPDDPEVTDGTFWLIGFGLVATKNIPPGLLGTVTSVNKDGEG